MDAAKDMFEHGLWFDGVVRGLVKELGLTHDEATRAAITAIRQLYEEGKRPSDDFRSGA